MKVWDGTDVVAVDADSAMIVSLGTDTLNVNSTDTVWTQASDTVPIKGTDTLWVKQADTVWIKGSDTLEIDVTDTAWTRIADSSFVRIPAADTVKVSLFGGGAGRPITLDPSTYAQTSITYEHHEVHGGRHYSYCQYDADFDIADTVSLILFQPDTTRWAHLVWELSGALTTKLLMYKGSTHGPADTLTAYNNNMNSANVPVMVISNSDGAGANGTLIDCASFGVSTGQGTNARSGGGSGRGGQEWILDQNTKTFFQVTSGADNNNMSLKFSWYEHVDKE